MSDTVESLQGTVSTEVGHLYGTLTVGVGHLYGTLEAKVGHLTAQMSAKNDVTPTYDGDYTVRSEIDEDYELLTSLRLMKQNIVVKKIPYYEASNTSGGYTAYIGSEVEFE